MPRPGDKIGPYTLISKLGRGAFGVVWLAEKRTAITTTKVAIKIPNDEDVDLEAVRQEASLWVHASGHPNVLPIIDADIYDEQVIIVSEYAPDGSLAKWLEQHGGKAPSVESAVEMTLGVLAGLEHLHKRGIIHRDLKPDNILLQSETPRLADFGISRILKTTTKRTMATGTPSYMPPEAFDGKRSDRTDIWSVGVIFYQLLSGRLPFPQAEVTSLIGAIVTKEPDPLPVTIPHQIQDVIRRALQKDAERRYQSAGEMRKALNSARRVIAPSTSEVETHILPPPTIPSPVQAETLKEPDTLLLSKEDVPSEPQESGEAAATTKVLSPPTLSPENTSSLTSPTLFGASNETYSQPERISPRLAWAGLLALLILGAVGIIYVTSSSPADEASQTSSPDMPVQENNSSSDNQTPTSSATSANANDNVRNANKTASASPAATPTPVSVTPTPSPASRLPIANANVGDGRGIGAGIGSGAGPGDGGGGPGGGGGDTDYNRVFKPSEVTQKAAITSRREAQYTEAARQNQVAGTVVLRMVLYSSGVVGNISVVKGLPYGLTERCIAAAKQTKFRPAIKDGRPVSQYIQVEYNFNLY